MTGDENISVSAAGSPRVLVVGDADRAFEDPAQILTQPSWSVCENVLDAIAMAVQDDFDTILIVMSSFNGTLSAAIDAVGRVGGDARIILLAQMYDEPEANELTNPANGGKRRADDYFICPVTVEMLTEDAGSRESGTKQISSVQQSYYQWRIRELEKLATEDDLTGLKNRRYVREFLRQIIARAEAGNQPVTLLIFDIDNFKHYNDAYGHSVGDTVLRQVAVMMSRSCRQCDVIGRIGGDEFAVIFWDYQEGGEIAGTKEERRRSDGSHPCEPLFMVERFRREIKSAELSFLGPEGRGVLTISGGLATYPLDGTTVEELFEQADEAMLEAKQSGKNQIFLVGQPQQ